VEADEPRAEVGGGVDGVDEGGVVGEVDHCVGSDVCVWCVVCVCVACAWMWK
jgi:hypothetical protein